MSEWTKDARSYLTGYLQQVGALAAERGDDAQEITEQLRDHVERELAQQDLPLVTVEQVRHVLRILGTPEEVLSAEGLAHSAPPRPPMPRALPPSATPPISIFNQPRQSTLGRNCLLLALAAVACAILLPVLLILLAIGVPAVSRNQEAGKRADCANNLKQLGLFLMEYEDKHGSLPPLSTTPGELMFSGSDEGAGHLNLRSLLVCPSHPNAEGLDASYIYFPFAPQTMEERETLTKNYQAKVDGTGPVPLRELGTPVSMKEPAEGGSAQGAKARSATPILMERGDWHQPAGGNVLYLDGHVEFKKLNELPQQGAVSYYQTIQRLDAIDGD